MSLMDHILNVAGFGPGTFEAADIKSGHTITKIDWDGCMANVRKEIDTGDIVRHAPSPHSNGRYPGIIVKWDKKGERWEPLQHVRRVNGAWELWE